MCAAWEICFPCSGQYKCSRKCIWRHFYQYMCYLYVLYLIIYGTIVGHSFGNTTQFSWHTNALGSGRLKFVCQESDSAWHCSCTMLLPDIINKWIHSYVIMQKRCAICCIKAIHEYSERENLWTGHMVSRVFAIHNFEFSLCKHEDGKHIRT